jgi:hypothetical protein
VIVGEVERASWRWEQLPPAMKSNIEARLDQKLADAQGLSDVEFQLLRDADDEFDEIVENGGVDEHGINVLEIFMEAQWRAEQGYLAKGQDCCHIYAHSSGGGFCRLNYCGLCR